MDLEVSRQIIKKKIHIQFNANLSMGAELLSCSMRTDGQTDRYTDITKQIVAFRNFVKEPKSWFQSFRGVLTMSGAIYSSPDIS